MRETSEVAPPSVVAETSEVHGNTTFPETFEVASASLRVKTSKVYPLSGLTL